MSGHSNSSLTCIKYTNCDLCDDNLINLAFILFELFLFCSLLKSSNVRTQCFCCNAFFCRENDTEYERKKKTMINMPSNNGTLLFVYICANILYYL